jgi:hypothetical protein
MMLSFDSGGGRVVAATEFTLHGGAGSRVEAAWRSGGDQSPPDLHLISKTADA